MDVVALIGRILFVALFLGSAFAHLTQTEAMAGYAAAKGVPQPKLAVLGSGVLMLVGAVLVRVGVWIGLGALLLVVWVVPRALLMPQFWKETDPQAKQVEMSQFRRDLALAGGALLILALYGGFGDGLGITITGPLF